jgi:heme oxygenase
MSLPLRQTLREKTARLHQIVDTHPTLRALSADQPSVAELYQALSVMAHAYERIERVLAAAPAPLSDLVHPIPAWTATLREDRLRLADWQSNADFLSLPPPRVPGSHAEWLGYLYVVLGSSLGSGNIAKRLAAHAVSAVHDLQFFRLNASHASRFGRLIAHLDRLEGEESVAGLVDGATLGFDDFISAADGIRMAARTRGASRTLAAEHAQHQMAAVSP